MPIKFDKNKLKEIERYDDFIKNSKHLPYTPTILTKYERSIMESLAIDVSDKVKTYADIPTSVLKRYIQKYSEVDYYNPLKKIVEQKNKDFSKEEIERYDDFIKNSKHLPYTPTILTKYERSIMESLAIDVSDKVKTYADIPTSVLKRYIQKYSEVDYYNPLKKIVEQKNKDFSKEEIEKFIENLLAIWIWTHEHSKPRYVSSEGKSILNILSNSKYYIAHKEEIKKNLKKNVIKNLKNSILIKTILCFLLQPYSKAYPII